MGGKSGSSGSISTAVSPYETQMANIISQEYENTTPMRSMITGDLTNFLNTGAISDSLSPVYAAGKSGIEGQYNIGKENLLASVPRGGGMTQGLVDLESNRADSLGNLQGDIATDMYNKAYGYATGTPSQSVSGLSNVSGTYSNRMAAETAANAQQNAAATSAMGNLGQGLGKVAASLIGGK